MIKGALAVTSFILAVVAIYFRFIQIPEFLSLPHLSVTLVNTTDPDKMTTSISRSVVKKVLAIEQAEGQGARVRRSIGSMSLRNLTPFLMLDHFSGTEGAGFPDHPHRGQATVTYMLEGKGRHEDSAGHKGTIEKGGVQWMIAGRGIIHAEMPIYEKDLPNPVGLQLWVDLPKQYKMVEPSYQELGPKEIPSAWPEGENGPVEVKIISGKSHGGESPVRPLGGCWYFHVIFHREGKMFQPLPSEWTSFIYIIKGEVIVNPSSSQTALPNAAFHTLVLSNEKNETGVELKGSEGTELILVSGEPLDQTVVQYGPFVMTSKQEVQDTLMDYQFGRNGFEKAHTWKSEIGGM